MLDAIDAFADDPRPQSSVPWGLVLSRMHVGPYRVLYETAETTTWVRRIDRIL